jgi:hypothetical protein
LLYNIHWFCLFFLLILFSLPSTSFSSTTVTSVSVSLRLSQSLFSFLNFISRSYCVCSFKLKRFEGCCIFGRCLFSRLLNFHCFYMCFWLFVIRYGTELIILRPC